MPETNKFSDDAEQPVTSVPRTSYGRDGVDETHPAFGVAIVTRGSGSSRSLFQSDVLHSQTITLSIQTATRTRDLNHDWVHPKEELIQAEMSLAQWGALVSSIGIGSGVPVTLRRTEGTARLPELPYQPRFKASLDEVNGTVGKLLTRARETLSELKQAIEGKQGVRAVRDALRLHEGSITHAENNTEFAVSSMVAAGEKVTSQVRADIESQILAAGRLVDHAGVISAPEMRLGEIEAADGSCCRDTPNETDVPMTHDESTVHEEPEITLVTCRLCLGSGRIAVSPWGVNPVKKTCPECLGKKALPEDHHYQDHTI